MTRWWFYPHTHSKGEIIRIVEEGLFEIIMIVEGMFAAAAPLPALPSTMRNPTFPAGINI